MPQSHPGERRDVIGDLVDVRPPGLYPPLADERHHSDEGVSVDRGVLRIVARVLEGGAEHVTARTATSLSRLDMPPRADATGAL